MDKTALQTILRKTKKGDKNAFKILFESYQVQLYNYLFFKSKDTSLSEDILQETFLKLWENRNKLDENQSVKAYLYRIANNLLLNHHRHLNIVKKHGSENSTKKFLEINDPQFLLEEQEFQFTLMNALENLPERTREIFLMSRIESLPNKEISERLEISLKTVESHIGKALKQLSQSIPKHHFTKNK